MPKNNQVNLKLTPSVVSVIVPTLAKNKREQKLKRCIESIRNSSSTEIQIIVIVNGDKFDVDLCNWLKRQADVLFDYQTIPSAPNAQFRGRQLVTTPYFSFLDDDDEYLPHAIDLRIARLESCSDADFLVSNGYLHSINMDEVYFNNFSKIATDPLLVLLRDYNWLHNCNALFKTCSISDDFFQDFHPYCEWTWLAYKLIMAGKRLTFLDEPTFRYYDTPESLSKSEVYFNSIIDLYERMLAVSPPPEVTQLIYRRISAYWHEKSVDALKNNLLRKAFVFHWRSLLHSGGLMYLSYSRHLFMALVRLL